MVSIVLAAKIKPTSHKLAAVCLAERCGVHTGTAFVGHAGMAARVGVSIGQMKRVMRELKAQGIVIVVKGEKGGRPGMVPTYKFNLQTLRQLSQGSEAERGAQVLPLIPDRAQEEGRSRTDGGRLCSERGGADAPQTGIGTSKEPKNAHTGANKLKPWLTPEAEQPNSGHQEEQQDASAARARLRVLADSIRQRQR